MTTDWKAANQSVRALGAWKPANALTGHGRPVGGSGLAADFERLAVPEQGRFVDGAQA